MSFVDVILERRSVRSGFRSESIPSDHLQLIADCGLAAPSSKAAQPWRLHLVTARNLLTQVAALVTAAEGGDAFVPIDPTTGAPHQWESTVVESADIFRAVPAAIFVENLGPVSGGRAHAAAAPAHLRQNMLIGYGLEYLGLGAAIENLQLAATALGYGTTFVGDIMIAAPGICDLFGMTGDLVGAVTIGRSDTPANPRRLASDRLVYHTGE